MSLCVFHGIKFKMEDKNTLEFSALYLVDMKANQLKIELINLAVTTYFWILPYFSGCFLDLLLVVRKTLTSTSMCLISILPLFT